MRTARRARPVVAVVALAAAVALAGCAPATDRGAPTPGSSTPPAPSSPATPSTPATGSLDAVTRTAEVAYGPDPAQVLDTYVPGREVPSPTGDPDARPALLLVHGGGWTRGTRLAHGEAATGLAALGWVTVTVDYRLAPDHEHPAAEEDVRAALAHVHDRAGELGIDPGRVVVAGDSAGGHLSGLVALSDDRPPVAAWVSWSGVYDVPSLPDRLAGTSSAWLVDRLGAYLGCEDPAGPACAERAAAASPITRASGDDPPALLLHSTDELVPLADAEAMRDRLAEAGARVRLVTFPGSAHGTALYEPASEDVADFLADVLDLRPAP